MKSKRGWTATNRLKTNQLFGSLFPRDAKMLDAIADHMTANGYDQSQPIIVWDRTEEENNRHALYVVDGHSRMCAAVKAGISPVYVARVKFVSEKEALEYAIHNQRDRRNITDADLIRCVQVVDSRKLRGGDRKSKDAKSKTSTEVIDSGKSSAQKTAEIVGTKPFIETMRETLGFRAKGRKIIGADDTFELREVIAPYGNADDQMSGNTFLWNQPIDRLPSRTSGSNDRIYRQPAS